MVKQKIVIHQMILVFSVTLITLEITVKYRKVLTITIETDVFQDIACFNLSSEVFSDTSDKIISRFNSRVKT